MSLEHITTDVTLSAPSGFHARPASVFAKMAKDFEGDITLTLGERHANGKSVMNLLTLGAAPGSVVTLEVVGPGAEEMANSLAEFLRTMD
jgi:phosphotransferase system HPr (HPr) family protein